jgi:RND family efflux transporter MFP subunit
MRLPAFRSVVPALLAAALAVLAAREAQAGEIVLAPRPIAQMKAVFGKVEARDVIAARARIGGTLARITVTEGSQVRAGEVIALVTDDKLALQISAAEARIRALESQLSNARDELERAQALLARGSSTQQRVDQLRTQTEVVANQITAAQAERTVVLQQRSEGEVLAPATGRVLRVPVTAGAVIMPGEAVAQIAGGGLFLRLALPERHAPLLKVGSEVAIEGRGAVLTGRLVKLYPQIENGRVVADVEAGELSGPFVGERVLVRVPIGSREVLAVPRAAVVTRSGLDMVRLATQDGPREVVVVLGEALGATDVEVLTGLKAGDRVLVP